MTYDQALMKYGKPISITEGEAVFLATWGNQSTIKATIPLYRTMMTMPISKGWKLDLAFDKYTKKLRNWNHSEG